MSNTLFGTWIVRSLGHKLFFILSESVDLCIFQRDEKDSNFVSVGDN